MCKLAPLPIAAAVVAATLTLAGCAGGNAKVDLATACKLYKLQELPAKVIASLVPVPGVNAGVTTAQAAADAICASVLGPSPAPTPAPAPAPAKVAGK